MPKKRVNKTKQAIRTKFRIGNAKGGKGAHSMTTADLLNVLDDNNKKKYRNNAKRVLAARGLMHHDKTTFELIADSE
jgi:hypothetical protein